jgi:hypothetical protein
MLLPGSRQIYETSGSPERSLLKRLLRPPLRAAVLREDLRPRRDAPFLLAAIERLPRREPRLAPARFEPPLDFRFLARAMTVSIVL